MVEQWTFNPAVLGSNPSMFKRQLSFYTVNLAVHNFLSSLKNASLVQKKFLVIKFNKIFLVILKILYNEGLILNYTKKEDMLLIKFRYYYNINPLKGIKIMSTVSRPIYLSKNDINKVIEKNKLLILSTSKGLLTSLECKNLKIGGKLLFVC